nr:hypothetical protein JOCKYQNQ_JOCKYQNQ_CDS_0016 [Autographiviridae sp.]
MYSKLLSIITANSPLLENLFSFSGLFFRSYICI